MQRARRTNRWNRRAVALAASAVLALQAVLLTFTPPVAAPAPAAVHGQHEHHGHEADPPDRPADNASHHRGLCCILAGKLGTAFGPVATAPALSAPMGLRVELHPVRARVTIAARPQSGALGARGPPALAI
jgi:hypothetical protein